ncbi:MAG: DNA/RNA nuclease SfsA [Nitrospirota bacterium]|nr:DNA/RNA nuclease SfsA [Nitrospirota bacterium]
MPLFENIIHASFISRPNRFVILCTIEGKAVRAYLPNPGRLWELLFPGTRLALVKFPPSAERKLKYLVVAVEHSGQWIMLHTHHTNTVARQLIEQNRIPGLEGAEIVQAEYKIGHSRFDFLLKKDNKEVLLEVKSCTLFHHTLAMFPDAISARATRYLLELQELSHKGYTTAVLFVVHSPRMQYFMPEHHTDLEFTQTLAQVRNDVLVRAVSVEWKDDLSLGTETRNLVIPWDLVEREAHDSGSYIFVVRLERDRAIEIGSMGKVKFSKGFYCYVGSAKLHLTKRLARHQRITKKHHWHIDYLRQEASFHAAIAIRTTADLECEIAGSLEKIADWQVKGFGCSDCQCPTHLFGMQNDPVHDKKFIEMLLEFRMGRMEKELSEGLGRQKRIKLQNKD